MQLERLYPTINDDTIDVKHFVYVKLVIKKIFSSTVTEIVPLTLYSTALSQPSIIPSAPFDEYERDETPSINIHFASSTSSFHIPNNNFLNFGIAPPAYDLTLWKASNNDEELN
uniref:Uncharacterized protein n=1 Tax=Panagrolaimus davidi TaxID=227884 RepID=A0A914NYE3_9BILA